jgi:hypothetical protein
MLENAHLPVELHRSVESLHQRLCQPREKFPVAVLYIVRERDLSKMVDLKERSSDTRLVLVLPNRNAETISKGHSLRPSFLTFVDTDPGEVMAVLKNILKRQIRSAPSIKERLSPSPDRE